MLSVGIAVAGFAPSAPQGCRVPAAMEPELGAGLVFPIYGLWLDEHVQTHVSAATRAPRRMCPLHPRHQLLLRAASAWAV